MPLLLIEEQAALFPQLDHDLPGAQLLQRVENLMNAGEAIPRVDVSSKMPEVIYEMSKKGLGMTTVVQDGNRLAGIITDGDLRRLMQKRQAEAFSLTAGECMTREPVTIEAKELASVALKRMEERKITSVVVVDDQRHVQGVLHIHDLWTLQLF